MENKKVLFISDGTDFKRGKGIVSRSNLRILNEVFGVDNVTVFTLVGMSGINDFPSMENKIISIQGYITRIKSLLNIIGLRHYHLSRSTEKKIISILPNYNLVFIDDSYFGRLSRACYALNIPNILFFHNVRSYLSKKWLKYIGMRYFPAHVACIYNEYIGVKYSDYNIVLNEREFNLFYKAYKKNPDMVLPIQMEDAFKLSDSTNAKFDLLFVGADYYPNVEGVRWFINHVVPFLDNKIKLCIVGHGMEKYRDEFDILDSVVTFGTVESVTPFYNSSKIVVLPIFDGGGMKVKTAESLMFGKVIIGTKEALEGYQRSEDIIEANNRDDFISSINKVLACDDQGVIFSDVNREIFQSNHDMKKSISIFNRVFK